MVDTSSLSHWEHSTMIHMQHTHTHREKTSTIFCPILQPVWQNVNGLMTVTAFTSSPFSCFNLVRDRRMHLNQLILPGDVKMQRLFHPLVYFAFILHLSRFAEVKSV